jgi:tRNA acetyltransferase TAN1
MFAMIIAKTQRGMEHIAASHVRDALGDSGDEGEVRIEVRPAGYLGLVIIHSNEIEKVKEVPEIERAIPVVTVCKADPDEIAAKAEEIVGAMGSFSSFAVRTTRRGRKHHFTSVDVNIRLGARIKELSGADVSLDFPEKAVYVEIIGDTAYIGVLDGKEERKKYTPDKVDSRKLFEKVSIVQLPYLEDYVAAREMGERIGRAAQSFEIKELVIAPFGYVDAYQLSEFIKGVRRGQLSRLEIQRKSYDREVNEVDILLQDIYQTVRDKRRKGNVLIITDPTGRQISEVKYQLGRDLKVAKEVVVFIGSRTGIPKGVFRFADYVVDLAPRITFATEHAIPAALIALIGIFEEEESV